MRAALICHPDTPCDIPLAIEVEAARAGATLALTYVATGAIDRLYVPPPAAPARTDELWRRTCFEAFVRPGSGDGYLEFNLSPSTQWAAYRFAGYREGMAALEVTPPTITVRRAPDRLELTAALVLPPDAVTADWRLGLTAVIEDAAGGKSYWALAHPPGRPDFHHAGGFAVDLLAA